MRSFALKALIICCVVFGVAVAAYAQPASQDNGRIAWSRYTDQSFTAARIVTGNPDGSGVRVLTRSSKGTYDLDPVWSPDASRIVFERDGRDGHARIVTMNADGTGKQVVDTGCVEPCADDIGPSWTPDGQQIAFTRVVGPFEECGDSAASAVLWVANADGGGAQRLSEPGIDGVYEDYRARWSPDGSYIQFLRVRNCPFDTAVFRMNADGSDVRQLTPWELDADESDLSRTLSGPSKDLVAFETFGHGGPASNVATVPATCTTLADCTSQISYVTSNDADGPTLSTNPAWSPDGTRIAFAEWTFPFDRSGRPHAGWYSDIFTMNPSGGDRRRVSTSVHWDLRPNWGVAR